MSVDNLYKWAVALLRAATRERLTVSHPKSRQILWTSEFLQGLVCLLIDEETNKARIFAPAITLLFVDSRHFLDQASSSRVSRLLEFVRYEVLSVLYQYIEDADLRGYGSRMPTRETRVAVCDGLLAPLLPLQDHADFLNRIA